MTASSPSEYSLAEAERASKLARIDAVLGRAGADRTRATSPRFDEGLRHMR